MSRGMRSHGRSQPSDRVGRGPPWDLRKNRFICCSSIVAKLQRVRADIFSLMAHTHGPRWLRHCEEFVRRPFDDLNHDVLGPFGDGNIIILSDSDKEEVREEKAADAEAAPSSVAMFPAPTASTDDDNGSYKSKTSDQAAGGCSRGGDEARSP
jgi:hypothetical protein